MSTMYKHWTELIKPKQLEVEERTLTATFGRFTAEPFERGFGQTIGNSVRRILLSSLMGASIVAVRIKGVLHEFSTVARGHGGCCRNYSKLKRSSPAAERG